MFKFNVRYLYEKDLNNLENYDIKAVLMTLQFLLEHSWNQISGGKIKKYHLVPLHAVKPSIKNHYKQSELEETQNNTSNSLISFAYKDKGRLLGFRKDKEFFLTYIDADHIYTK